MFSQPAAPPDPEAPVRPSGVPETAVADTRARSVQRAQQLVAAARDLADEHHSAAFTVHDVAARAGSSLKGFYRCFAGKDDLLVALLAEDSRIGAEILGAWVQEQPTHVGRLRTCVTGLFALCALPGAEGYTRVLVSEHRRLSQERADELRAALAPVVDVITGVIADAARAGAAESAAPARDAATIFSLILDGIHAVSFGRAEPADQSDYLWQFCGRALRVADPVSSMSPSGGTP
jgi:AcrR family transcriptional regulator